MTVEFNAESWRAASNRTRGVLNILMPFLEQATTGTPLGGVSQNPVDRAIFDGL